MRTKLKDVASRAGVAPNTASTILNHRSNSWASKDTRERVFKAAQELGYQPNRAAQGVRMGRFKAVALVLPDLHNPYYTAFASAFSHEVRQREYDLIIEHTDSDLEFERQCLESLFNRQIDGVACFVSQLESHLKYVETAKKAGKSVVALTGPAPEGSTLPFDAVTINFSNGLKEAIEHLAALGHKRFAFLCALAKGQAVGNRPKIFNDLLAEMGIPDSNIDFIPCPHNLGSIREALLTFLKDNAVAPTALIALNDLSAIGAIRAALDFGLRVPEDLSVIGVDHIPLGDHLEHRLTTIEQPVEAMARSAAQILLGRLEDGDKAGQKPRCTAYISKLILKETTAEAHS